MSSYAASTSRCQHIKVNGTQCGSPALREEKYCYFHMRWHASRMSVILKEREHWIAGLHTIEDGNSVQVGLAEVMRLLVTEEIYHKTGALLLYAMQTASANLKRTSFEPEPTRVVIDRECVERRPIGATAWSKVEGREYDEAESDHGENDDTATDKLFEKESGGDADLRRMIVRGARNAKFLNQRPGTLGGHRSKRTTVHP